MTTDNQSSNSNTNSPPHPADSPAVNPAPGGQGGVNVAAVPVEKTADSVGGVPPAAPATDDTGNT